MLFRWVVCGMVQAKDIEKSNVILQQSHVSTHKTHCGFPVNWPIGVSVYAVNPLVPKQSNICHDVSFALFPPVTVQFDPDFVQTNLGVKVRYAYDCVRGADAYGYYDIVPSRRIPCDQHKSLVDKHFTGMYTPPLPVVDDEYVEQQDLYGAVERALRHSKAFIIGEVGARYGTWAMRGIAAYRMMRPNGSYRAFVVEPNVVSWPMQHLLDNGVPRSAIVAESRYIGDKTTGNVVALEEALEPFDHIDYFDWDCQGCEIMLPAHIDLLASKVYRLHIGVHGCRDALKKVFDHDPRWKKNIELHNHAIGTCEQTVVGSVQRNMKCVSVTPQGPVYIRDGILSYDNVKLLASM